MTTPVTSPDLDPSINESEQPVSRRLLQWSAHYLFWLIVLGAVIVATWMSASGSSAFRYAGF